MKLMKLSNLMPQKGIMQASCLVLLYTIIIIVVLQKKLIRMLQNFYGSKLFLNIVTNIMISKSKVGINMYVYYMYYFVCNNRKHSMVLWIPKANISGFTTKQSRKESSQWQENKNYATPESCMQAIIIDLDVLC